MIFIENPKPGKSSEFWSTFGICWISLQNQLLVNGMSYFEIETQLLTFRKDMNSRTTLFSQTATEAKQIDGGDWGVQSQTIGGQETF